MTKGKNAQLVVAGEKWSSGEDEGSGDKGISADEAVPESRDWTSDRVDNYEDWVWDENWLVSLDCNGDATWWVFSIWVC